MHTSSESDDYVVMPGSNARVINNMYQQPPYTNTGEDATRNRQIKEYQEEVDRLKLENYHLKDELRQKNEFNESLNMRIGELEEENTRLQQVLRRNSGSESGHSQNTDKYDKALREISKLLKINNELRTELDYSKEAGRAARND